MKNARLAVRVSTKEGFVLKVRVKFTKKSSMSYIGHLDVMRYFQKLMRRAQMPIAFSSGYSPHMIMSFASPLSLGVTSEAEYFDIELTEKVSSKEAVARMNEAGVEGIEVLSFLQIPSEKKMTAMSIFSAASYRVTLEDFCDEGESPSFQEKDYLLEECSKAHEGKNTIEKFMNQTEILILKKTKKSEGLVDIKPFIYELKSRDNTSVTMTLAAGSKENLKPNLVMKALCSFQEKEYNESTYSFHRLEMFADSLENGQLVTLESFGKEIF